MKRKVDNLDEVEITLQERFEAISKRLNTNLCKKDEILGTHFSTYINDLIDIFEEEVVAVPENDCFLRERWPSKTPSQVKLLFLENIGTLSFKTPPIIVAKYIRTLEDLNSNNEGSLLFNLQGMYVNNRDPFQNQSIFETNLAFCWLLKPSIKLVGTSFEDIPLGEYSDRIKALQRQSRENISLYKQIVGINEARQSQKELPFLYPEVSIAALDDLKNEDDCDPQPHQKLLEFLLTYAASRGIKKSVTAIYKEVVCMPENTRTFHYKYHKDFLEWIYEVVGCSATHRYETYALTKNAITPTLCVNFLTQTQDPRLTTLKKNRNLFSYRNGIFNAKTGRFHLYHKLSNNHQDLSNFNIGYVDSELKSDEQTANFFEVPLLLEYFRKNPYIKTNDKKANGPYKEFAKKQFALIDVPAYDKILLSQRFSPKDIKFYQFSLGRLLHDTGSMDNFQLSHFNVGVGGSGKSTMLGKFSDVYEKVDVGTIMDDAETKFTDQHLLDKFMVVGADISSEISVSTTRFNCWITGDDITINRKHLTAISKKWTAPMCFGSNEYPGIKSKAGSGARRFLFFLFNYAVTNSDPQLPHLLTEQLPRFLVKCALRYLHYATKYKSQSIWEKKPSGKNILPNMCHIARKEYVSRTSCPDAFLDSSVCTFNSDYNCSKKNLVAAYEYFLSQMSARTQGSLYAKKSPESCTATNFAYALNMRGCEWDVSKDIIYGLRITSSTTNESSEKFIPHANKNTKPNEVKSCEF